MPNKHQKNNKGFSLLELLVSITVLAIIMIPLLHSFITSARTNAKARKIMEATAAAQNTFEELKSTDVKDYIKEDTTSETIMSTGVSPAPFQDADGNDICKYTKTFSVTASGKTFLAKVVLDPEKYLTQPGDTVGNTDFNSIGFSNISNLSKASNAFYIQNSDQDLLAAKAIDPVEYEDVMKHMSRVIQLDVEHDDTTKLSKVFVTVTYKDERAGSAGQQYTAISHQEIYNNSSMIENTLSNVFACFYPMYNNESKNNPTEKIIINNPSNYKIGVYLVKQTVASDSAAYSSQIAKYMVDLEVAEGNRDSESSSEEDSFWKKKSDGSVSSVMNVITAVTTNLEYKDFEQQGQLKINYHNSNISANQVPSGKTGKDMVGLKTDLSRPQEDTRIYDVTVEIYDKDDTSYAKCLTKMEGTKIQ